MSDLVCIEDLGELDGGDLKAVLGQVDPEQLLEALVGVSPWFRTRLLTKLSPASASLLEAQILARGPVEPASARTAQRAVVEALCRLSRVGAIAFDDPEDMLDQVA